jgi:HSP20 family protein
MAVDLLPTGPFFTSPFYQVVDRVSEQVSAVLSANPASDGASAGLQTLPVDVWESEDAYQVAFLVPDADANSLKVSVDDDALIVEGELKFEVPERATVVCQEFPIGPIRFRRQLRLDAAVDSSKIEATYRNGVLRAVMPKVEQARWHQVRVQPGESKATPELVSA